MALKLILIQWAGEEIFCTKVGRSSFIRILRNNNFRKLSQTKKLYATFLAHIARFYDIFETNLYIIDIFDIE